MGQLKEKCINYLREEGYCPTVDNDGDVMFKVQGATLFLMDDENDETFLKIWLPQFWSLDDDQERAKAHFVSNKLNKERNNRCSPYADQFIIAGKSPNASV